LCVPLVVNDFQENIVHVLSNYYLTKSTLASNLLTQSLGHTFLRLLKLIKAIDEK